MPVNPVNVVKDVTTLRKILIAENAIRITNAVSNAAKGFFQLQTARKKNSVEKSIAITTTTCFRLLSAKMKKIPINKNEAITYKTILATSTAFSALIKSFVQC